MEVSARPSPSPDRGLKLLRSRGKDSPSTMSLSTSSPGRDDSASFKSGKRSSIDRGIDKLADKFSRTSSDLEGANGHDSSRLSRLIPSRSRKSKSKKNKSFLHFSPTRDGQGSAGLLSARNSRLNLQSENTSQDSLAKSRSGASSLLTDDSDPDA